MQVKAQWHGDFAMTSQFAGLRSKYLISPFHQIQDYKYYNKAFYQQKRSSALVCIWNYISYKVFDKNDKGRVLQDMWCVLVGG